MSLPTGLLAVGLAFGMTLQGCTPTETVDANGLLQTLFHHRPVLSSKTSLSQPRHEESFMQVPDDAGDDSLHDDADDLAGTGSSDTLATESRDSEDGEHGVDDLDAEAPSAELKVAASSGAQSGSARGAWKSLMQVEDVRQQSELQGDYDKISKLDDPDAIDKAMKQAWSRMETEDRQLTKRVQHVDPISLRKHKRPRLMLEQLGQATTVKRAAEDAAPDFSSRALWPGARQQIPWAAVARRDGEKQQASERQRLRGEQSTLDLGVADSPPGYATSDDDAPFAD